MSSKDFSKRVIELDYIRGISVLFMLFFHTLAFFSYCGPFCRIFEYPGDSQTARIFLNFANDFFNNNIINYIFANLFRGLFIFCIGCCFTFSRNNFKRSLKVFAASLVVTAISFVLAFITKDLRFLITFGIIHTIVISLFICSILYKYIENKYFYLICGIILTIIGWKFLSEDTYAWVYYFEDIPFYKILFFQFLGKVGAGFDSFPGLLYLGVVMISIFLGKVLYKEKKSIFNAKYEDNWLSFIGRNSIHFYILGQVIIIILCFFLLLLLGFKLK